MLVLHHNELSPAVLFSDMVEKSKLPGVHRAGAEVANFAGDDEVMQSADGFLYGDLIVVAMDNQNVNVRCVQS